MSYQSYESKTIADKVPLNRNPFSSMIACLQSKNSIGARMVSKKEIAKNLNDYIGQLKSTGLKKENAEKSLEMKEALEAKKNVNNLMNEKGACSFIPGGKGTSQIQEAFADQMAAKVLAADIAKKPEPERKEAAFQSASFFLGTHCPAVSEQTVKQADEIMKATKCGPYMATGKDYATLSTLYRAREIMNNEHPWDSSRIDKISLANPTIRKALGCAPSREVKTCD